MTLSTLHTSLQAALHQGSSREVQDAAERQAPGGSGLALLDPPPAAAQLVAGQTLVLPTPAVAAAATHVPDPGIERYGSSSAKGAKLSPTSAIGVSLSVP